MRISIVGSSIWLGKKAYSDTHSNTRMSHVITFASLFLGLVLGEHAVEVVTTDEVVRVEILLNHEVIGTMNGKPWLASCDFGQKLAPGELEAVAFDDEGQELGRTRQWINLPRDPAAATVWLEPHKPGEERLARLSWQSLEALEPRSVSVWLDGSPVPVENPKAILLPPHSLDQLHFFRAELEFSDNIASVVELTFGGTYADSVNTEITAIPVRLADRSRKAPRLEDLQGLFVKGQKPLHVVAVEKGPAEVVVVMDRTFYLPKERPRPTLRLAAPLPFDTSLRFINPVPETRDVGFLFDLFPLSPPFGREHGGFYWILSQIRWPGSHPQDMVISDAVAVAGVVAYERRRRRAVLLVVSGSGTGLTSRLTPDQAQSYLESLRVPFYVWSPDPKPSDDLVESWKELADVSSVAKLGKAAKRLSDDLKGQWIVWIDGTHLPQDISISPRAKGIELVH